METKITKVITTISLVILLAACASRGVISNTPLQADSSHGYSLRNQGKNLRDSGDTALMLAFSGGGTRAAALTYGVLLELRDTGLLDEVDFVSSVSGGSFTAAYYGLYGDRIFEDFEDNFLRQDVEGYLFRRLFNPFRWIADAVKQRSRDEMAIEHYNKLLFKGATFADMRRNEGPTILINASDLGHGVRFSFIQEYFNLLCSDISTFPVARAVAASSAVPVLFQPIVMKNWAGCPPESTRWLREAEQRAKGNPQLEPVVARLQSYADKQQRQYIHFVDGGITDNLGLRSMYDVFEIAGGAGEAYKKFQRTVPDRMVVISVDASTHPRPEMDDTKKSPALGDTINAVTNTQLLRYSAETRNLIDRSLPIWAQELSTTEHTVEPFLVWLRLVEAAKDSADLEFLNQIPTSFSLTGEQVDRLIAAGRQLLRDNPEFRRLQADIAG